MSLQEGAVLLLLHTEIQAVSFVRTDTNNAHLSRK